MKKICLILALAAIVNAVSIVDVVGRTVEVQNKSNIKLVLGESRMIYALAPLFGKDGNPFKNIVGWKDDLAKYDPDAYERYKAKFPQLAKIANLGSPYSGDFDIEKVIQLKTDVVVLNLGNYFKAKETKLIEKLEKVGIKTIFVDFRQNPVQNTIPSVIALSKILDKRKEANDFIDFYIEQMQKVYAVVARKKDDERPLVLIENAANSGWSSDKEITTYGSSNMGRFVEIAGGKNLGSLITNAFKKKISVELVFKRNPDIIIGTGANWTKAKPTTGAVLLGYDAQYEDTQKRLKKIASRRGWENLKATKNKQFYSIYHQFYNSPYHFVAIQVFAKWFYPEDFKDLDPLATFKTLHNKFLPISHSGIFWTGLK